MKILNSTKPISLKLILILYFIIQENGFSIFNKKIALVALRDLKIMKTKYLFIKKKVKPGL
jgi:hypothetical protein